MLRPAMIGFLVVAVKAPSTACPEPVEGLGDFVAFAVVAISFYHRKTTTTESPSSAGGFNGKARYPPAVPGACNNAARAGRRFSHSRTNCGLCGLGNMAKGVTLKSVNNVAAICQVTESLVKSAFQPALSLELNLGVCTRQRSAKAAKFD